MNILKEKRDLKYDDLSKITWKFSSEKNQKTIKSWLCLLLEIEKKLPDSLPGAEEIDREKNDPNLSKNSYFRYTSTEMLEIITLCISYITKFDDPESDNEVELFLQRFNKKYGDSSGGKKMIELYKIERQQAKSAVHMKAAPWQVGPNPAGGCH